MVESALGRSASGGIREALRAVVESGRGVGVSSLRADRLDTEFVGLLARGGYRTMTVASDAPSQRLRNKMAKAIRTRHLIEAARLARGAGMNRLKLYVIIGIPGETDEDIEELIELCKELSAILPVALGLSPLVPKLHTPWETRLSPEFSPFSERSPVFERPLGASLMCAPRRVAGPGSSIE